MRVPTSIYSVKVVLGEDFESLANEYAEACGKQLEGDLLGWHWVLNELDIPMPKSAAALLKSDPSQHLAIGLSRGKFELRINVKPEAGKVWVSSVLPGSVAPREVADALKKRAMPSGSKWNGLLVDIFMPMHQKHPGLAEHAIIGGLQPADGGAPVYFISDRPDPLSAPMWHLFKLYPERRVAQALLAVVDKNGQKDFRSTLFGQEMVIRDFCGFKMTDLDIIESLRSVKKFAWRTDPGSSASVIPMNARKFKLGEELSLQECKNIPAAAYLGALDSLAGR